MTGIPSAIAVSAALLHHKKDAANTPKRKRNSTYSLSKYLHLIQQDGSVLLTEERLRPKAGLAAPVGPTFLLEMTQDQ
ncbi:hypothetical protein [Trichothermofontia sp.]